MPFIWRGVGIANVPPNYIHVYDKCTTVVDIKQCTVTVKSIILFGLWAKIPFPHLATSEIPSWVRPWM